MSLARITELMEQKPALIEVTPVITAGAYTANDCIGGKLTLANALSSIRSGMGRLLSISIQDLAAQKAALKIFFFKANPDSGTYTDNQPLDIHDTDMLDCLGVIEVDVGDYAEAADNAVATLTGIDKVVKADDKSTLYALVKVVGTPTYVSVSDLKFMFGFSSW